MAVSSSRASSRPIPTRFALPLWAWAAILTTLAAATGYILLPLAGVTALMSLLSFKMVMAACALLIAGVGYWSYLDWAGKRPQTIVLLVAIFYPLFIYLAMLLSQAGLDIRARILMLGLVCLPSALLSFRSAFALCRRYPHVWGCLAFAGVFLTYYFFFNADTPDPRAPGVGGHFGEAQLAFEKLYVTVALTAGTLLTAKVMTRLPDKSDFFRKFNYVLIGALVIYSLITTISYPLSGFTVMVDGFKRSQFIFTHPNHYAHYLGFLLTYLCGLWLYYRKQSKPPLPVALILVGIFVTLPAFMLAMSKTAMALTGICVVVMLIANQLADADNKLNPLLLAAPIAFCLLAAMALQALGIVDFIGTISARMEDQESLLWRFATWQRVFSDIDASSLLFGHGLTAANGRIIQLTMNYADVAKGVIASPFVHNAYVEVLYDFGLLGFGWLLGLLSMMVVAVRRFLSAPSQSAQKPLYLLAICLAIYFLGVCNFDEMFYSLSFPFWYFMTLVWGMTLSREAARGDVVQG